MTKKTTAQSVPDEHWIRTRQTILRGLKNQVSLRLGPEPKEIAKYRKKVEREFAKPFVHANKQDLLAKVAGADLIFGADFHAYGQAQRTHLKILKDRPVANRPLAIALEAFAVEHQALLDQFVRGQIGETELLKRVNWRESWGFPWENYRPLVLFARENGHALLAVGTVSLKATLQEREQRAADVLNAFFELNRSKKEKPQVYCLFGELHLGADGLPKLCTKSPSSKKIKILTIHLNSEQIYFRLARQGLENKIDVVRLGQWRYVVLASPPWVQWQSYLFYLENTLDQSLEDDESESVDLGAHIETLVRLAAGDLKLNLKSFDIQAYGAGDEKIWKQLKQRLLPKELRAAKILIESGRSFYVPDGNLFYLSRSTINHAAELAGHYIHAEISGYKRPLWRMPNDFQAQIWVGAVGFFISKLINHKRHSETLEDLQGRLNALSSRDQGREALMLALEHRFNEIWLFHRGRKRTSKIKPKRIVSRLEAARILGGMMGERLYLAMRSRKISLSAIKKWLAKKPTDTDFDVFYEEVMLRLGPQTGAPRTRKERL